MDARYVALVPWPCDAARKTHHKDGVHATDGCIAQENPYLDTDLFIIKGIDSDVGGGAGLSRSVAGM